MNVQRQIIFHKHYFIEFYQEQSEKVQEKIEYVFKLFRLSRMSLKSFSTI